MRSVVRRFGIGSVLALIVLLATGAAMAHFERWQDFAASLLVVWPGVELTH